MLFKANEQLRVHTGPYIGSINHGPLLTDYLDEEFAGPFRNENELNEALVNSFPKSNLRNYYVPYIRQMLKTAHNIVYSHGDFALRNLMVYNGALSAVIDWECVGFYREYWEYAIAYDRYVWKNTEYVDWNEYVQKCLRPYPVATAILDMVFRFSNGEA